MNHVLSWISEYGYAGLFAMLMFGIVGLPIPDETLLMFSGYLISQSRLHPAWTFLSCVSGSISGISLSYVVGRYVGHGLIYKYGRYIRVKPEHVERVHHWYRRSGEWLLVFGYFVPGVRHFSALVAGMSNLEYRAFALFAYLGAALWVSVFLSIGYLVGDNWELAMHLVHRYTVLLVGIGIVALAIFYCIRTRALRIRSKPLS